MAVFYVLKLEGGVEGGVVERERSQVSSGIFISFDAMK